MGGTLWADDKNDVHHVLQCKLSSVNNKGEWPTLVLSFTFGLKWLVTLNPKAVFIQAVNHFFPRDI